MQTKKPKLYFRDERGLRLNAGWSQQIRDGIFQKLGVGSLRVVVDPAGEWAPSTCLWCAQIVGSAILDDGDEEHFDLALDDEGQIVAEVWSPHKCEPMLASERYDDPEEVFRREMSAVEADWQDQVVTEEERAASKASSAALRARFAAKAAGHE